MKVDVFKSFLILFGKILLEDVITPSHKLYDKQAEK